MKTNIKQTLFDMFKHVIMLTNALMQSSLTLQNQNIIASVFIVYIRVELSRGGDPKS